jgi:hypothetical protein
MGPATSVFRTETRAVATDAFARAKFRRYWSFVSPGIWLIRRMSLGPLKREERRAGGRKRQRHRKALKPSVRRLDPALRPVGDSVALVTRERDQWSSRPPRPGFPEWAGLPFVENLRQISSGTIRQMCPCPPGCASRSRGCDPHIAPERRSTRWSCSAVKQWQSVVVIGPAHRSCRSLSRLMWPPRVARW